MAAAIRLSQQHSCSLPDASRAPDRKDSTPRHGRLLHPSSWAERDDRDHAAEKGGSPKTGHPISPRPSLTKCGFASKRSRKRVLHHCTHLGTKTCGRIQLDRCCLVIRMHKVKKFAPNFDVYVERLDWPTAPQHPHRGRDCRRRARLPKVVICERKN